ncbi:MAG: ChbG/HpnK family deacetylase, partial [Burkholderiaceae bacterium]
MAGLIKMRNTRNVKQLIINADDFGWDIDSCKATIDCMETGSVTSATIMTGRPATDMACEYA